MGDSDRLHLNHLCAFLHKSGAPTFDGDPSLKDYFVRQLCDPQIAKALEKEFSYLATWIYSPLSSDDFMFAPILRDLAILINFLSRPEIPPGIFGKSRSTEKVKGKEVPFYKRQ